MKPVLVTWPGGARLTTPHAVTDLVAAHGVIVVHVGWRAIATACWHRLWSWTR